MVSRIGRVGRVVFVLSLSLPLLVPSARAQNTNGLWEPPFDHVVPPAWQPGQPGFDGDPALGNFMAGHVALIPVGPHRGQVLAWNWMRIQNGAPLDKQYWAIVDPVTQTFNNFELPVTTSTGDLFCSGHAWTKDGHLLVVGGNRYIDTPILHDDGSHSLNANRNAFRFDPLAPLGNAMWVPEPSMFYERWYPTVTTMGTDPSGVDRLLVTGGFDQTFQGQVTYESFDPTPPLGQGVWQPNPNNPMQEPFFPGPSVCTPDSFAVYPRQALVSSGRLFVGGMSGLGYRVNHSATPPVWTVQAGDPGIPQRDYASAFLFPNLGGPGGGYEDLFVRVGGTARLWDYGTCMPASPDIVTNTIEYCLADLGSSDPNWRWFFGPSMAAPRTFANATLLPDSTVLVTGGVDQNGAPVITTELLNDVPLAWRTVAPMGVNRGYHGTAVLLPDGRVLSGGGEYRVNDYQLYQPPYLTNGSVRPVILNAPSTLQMKYGRQYFLEYQSLPPGVVIEKAVLMAPASLTHHSDMHQRYVEMKRPTMHILPFPPPPNPTFHFMAPAHSGKAPKGYYMLFLVTNAQGSNNKGTPSIATWVKLQ